MDTNRRMIILFIQASQENIIKVYSSENWQDFFPAMNFPVSAEHTYLIETKKSEGNFTGIKSYLHLISVPDKYPC